MLQFNGRFVPDGSIGFTRILDNSDILHPL